MALIAATAVGLGIYLHKPGFPVSVSVFMVLLAVETVFLVWYMVRIRRDLLNLINALRNEDATMRFPARSRDPYFSAIYMGFNEIIRDFRLIRLDREVEHRFFEATVNHISFGIAAFDRAGQIELANKAFLDMFHLERISAISDLEPVVPGLPGWIIGQAPGTDALRKLEIGGEVHHLIFLTTRFRLADRDITLLSVRDISREIDRNELEAWQKLMRVLRHEILNSVSPIKLISANLSAVLQDHGQPVPMESLSPGEIADIRLGLETIHRRASGLSGFLDAYTNLYRVPELRITNVNTAGLLERIRDLFAEQFGKLGIGCSITFEDPSLAIPADEQVIEQVLINLVKNAVEAVREAEDPGITLSARQQGKEAIISVSDNGQGIPADQLDHIFIPFYSTREDGTGVGLSFAQHVMRLHRGRIHVQSTPGQGSEFQLVFLCDP